MSETTHLGLPYLTAAQAQKHVTHNEALAMLDGLVQLSVISRGLPTPPATPDDGDRYLIASAASDGWAGRDGMIALWLAGLWRFLAPREGWTLWVDDEDVLLSFDGGGWNPTSGVVAAYAAMSDGSSTAHATLSDTFKFRAAPGLSASIGSDDPSHGDNLLVAPDLPGLPALTAPAGDDELLVHDASGAAHARLTLAAALKVAGLLNDVADPEVTADTLLLFDHSAGDAGKITPAVLDFARSQARGRLGFEFFTDFIQDTSSTASDNSLVEVNSGSGAASSPVALTGSAQVGVVQSTTGTTSTGRAALASGTSVLRFGAAAWLFEASLQVPTLSTSGERFALLIGFIDTHSTVNQADAAYFLYDEGGVALGSTASGNWQCVTANNATRSVSATATAVGTGFVRLGIAVNAAGTSVDFLIDGSVVATHTANIPTASGRDTGFGGLIIKSIGTTARAVNYDYMLATAKFQTPR